MDGVTLEAEELAYLMVTLSAKSLTGVEDARLCPATQAERETTYAAGLRLLKQNGHLKPGPGGSLRMDDALLYLVSVAAEPEFVIFTFRDMASGERQLVLHYLAGPAVVELSGTPNGKFRIGAIPDRAALAQRIADMLSIQPAAQPASVEFTIGGPIMGAVRGLATEGKTEQAAATLKSFGINVVNGEAMVNALHEPDTHGHVVITHLVNGQIQDGRRASVFGKHGRAWMMNRVDAETTAVRVQAIGPNTLLASVEDFIRLLTKGGKPG